MRILVLGVTLLFLAPLSSCIRIHGKGGEQKIIGSGNVVTIQRSPGGFHSVRLTGLGHLIVVQGNQDSVSITTDDNVESHMESTVDGGVLLLGPRSGVKIDTVAGIVWRITVQRLESLHTDGLVTAAAVGIVGDRFHVDMEGLSSVEASGVVGQFLLDADGIVNFDGSELETEECELNCDGVLSIAVHAHRLVNGRACGTGHVDVFGDAPIDVARCPLVVFRRR